MICICGKNVVPNRIVIETVRVVRIIDMSYCCPFFPWCLLIGKVDVYYLDLVSHSLINRTKTILHAKRKLFV